MEEKMYLDCKTNCYSDGSKTVTKNKSSFDIGLETIYNSQKCYFDEKITIDTCNIGIGFLQ